MKERLDVALVKRALCASRSLASRLVSEGRVQVNDRVVTKPAWPVKEEDLLTVISPPKFVGRGGEKLEGALETFALPVKGLTCLDVGASTGGFTDCLLQRGARKIVAVDVGKGQLVESLRNDPRVEWYESLDIRKVEKKEWKEAFDLAVVDVSFISLKLVLPAVVDFITAGGSLVALVKPQFEMGRRRIGKNGIVKNLEQRQEVVEQIADIFRPLSAWNVRGRIESSVRGGDGNQETFLWAQRSAKS